MSGMSETQEAERRQIEELIVERHGQSRLNKLSEDGLHRIRELYIEAYEEFGDETLAYVRASSDFNFERHVASADTVRINAIGANGPRPFGSEDALFLFGAAIPDEQPIGPIVVLIQESDVRSMSLVDVAREFTEFGAPFDLEIDYRPADVVSGGYVGEVVEGERFEDCFETPDADEVASEGERIQRIKDVTDGADIINIGENLSMQDDGYPADFGLDLKRIEPAAITSAQVSSKGARYEIQDQSFLDPEVELDDTVIGTEDKSSGLVGWAEPHVLAVEKGSMMNEMYGVVKTNDEGRVEYSVIGANPEKVKEAEIPDESASGSGGSSSSSASGEAVEDRMI